MLNDGSSGNGGIYPAAGSSKDAAEAKAQGLSLAMAPALQSNVLEDNERFAFDMRVFEPCFFKFASRLYSRLSATFIKEHTALATTLPQKNKALVRQASVSRANLAYVEWGVEFLMTVVCRAESYNSSVNELCRALGGMLSQSRSASEWFLVHLTEQSGDLKDLLLVCVDHHVRYNFAQLIQKALAKLSGEANGYFFEATEMKEGIDNANRVPGAAATAGVARAASPGPAVDESGDLSNIDFSCFDGLSKSASRSSSAVSENVSGTNQVACRFVQVLITMIAESATYWHRFDEFYSVLHAFAKASRANATYLGSPDINLAATLADFFLAEASPLSEQDALISPRKKMGNSMTPPDFKMVLATLAEIVVASPNAAGFLPPACARSFVLREGRRLQLIDMGLAVDPSGLTAETISDGNIAASKATAAGAAGGFGGHVPMDDVTKSLLMHAGLWSKAIGMANQRSRASIIESLSEILHHLSWGDFAFSDWAAVHLVSEADKAVKKHDMLPQFHQLLETLLCVPDTHPEGGALQQVRIKRVLGATWFQWEKAAHALSRASILRLQSERQQQQQQGQQEGKQRHIGAEEGDVPGMKSADGMTRRNVPTISTTRTESPGGRRSNVGGNRATATAAATAAAAAARNNNEEDAEADQVKETKAATSKRGSNNNDDSSNNPESEGKTQSATGNGSSGGGGNTEFQTSGTEGTFPMDSMLLHCIHKHHRLQPKWSLSCLRFIIRVMCCTEPVHKYVSGVAQEEAGGDFPMDRRFSDYFYRLLMSRPMQNLPMSAHVREAIRELEEYEVKYYGATRAKNENEDADADAEAGIPVAATEEKASRTGDESDETEQARDPLTMTVVDYFSRYKATRQRKPNHVDRDQGIVCEVYFCEDALDVENMHHVVFTFKNTNERPARISLEFVPDGTETHQTLPAASLKAKFVAAEGVLEMCRLPRLRFVKKWNPICLYKWKFTYVPLNESGGGGATAVAVASSSNLSASTPLASVVSPVGRPSNVQTVPAVVGPQLPQQQHHHHSNNNTSNSANPLAGVAADSARDMNMQSVTQVTADQEKVSQLEMMGLGSRSQCEQALVTYANNVESAANHLLGAM